MKTHRSISILLLFLLGLLAGATPPAVRAATFGLTVVETELDFSVFPWRRYPVTNGLHTTAWNGSYDTRGSGWEPSERLTVVLRGPLNTLGVAPGPDRILRSTFPVTASGQVTNKLFIPYDNDTIFGPAKPVTIPRPGYYHLIVTGNTSGRTATWPITIAPETTAGELPSGSAFPTFNPNGEPRYNGFFQV